MLVGLLANGHILTEGVPGLAKTTAVSCLAAGIDTETGLLCAAASPRLEPAYAAGF